MNQSDQRTLPAPPSADQLDRIEDGMWSRIRADETRRRTRRTRVWGGAVAAAAVVALAALISPAVLSSLTGPGTATSTVGRSEAMPMVEGVVPYSLPGTFESADIAGEESGALTDLDGAAVPDGSVADDGREIVATGWMQVTVDEASAAADRLTAIADDVGGYVEGVSLAQATTVTSGDMMIVPIGENWIRLRVPAAELDAVMTEAAGLGEVTSSTVDRSDVTDWAVDLRARVAAQETSVARLTELLARAESVADLISAENALAERQAALDADRQQLESLEGQVALSTLTVTLSEEGDPVQADPAGFGDGLSAGWNALVAALNGTVVALGFLLPWLGVVAVIAAIVWGVRRLRRRRRARGSER